MGQAFLTRLYGNVYDYLGDPHTERRLSKAKILEDYNSAERQVTNTLLRMGGAQSSINRAEATVTLQNGVSFYRLPPSFRQFIRLEYRQGGDRNSVTDVYKSTTDHNCFTRGVVVMSANRGFIVQPEPSLSESLDYTLIYQKGAIKIHNGTARDIGESDHAGWTDITCSVGSNTLVDNSAGGLFASWMAGFRFVISSGTNFTAGVYTISSVTDSDTIVLATDPLDGGGAGSSGVGYIGDALKLATSAASDGGEIVVLDDYYNGNFVHIYSGTTGVYQTREIVDHDATNAILKLRHVWDVKPTGTVLYEIRPTLDEDYDDLYAIMVAKKNCSRREQAKRWGGLQRDFKEQWSAVKETVLSNVADRPHERIMPDIPLEIDPYD